MKTFEELTSQELWGLRQEISLNSHYYADYINSYGFDEKSVCYFFEGYYDYIYELAEEKNENPTTDMIMQDYDNEENLYSWFNCYDDLTWIKQSKSD